MFNFSYLMLDILLIVLNCMLLWRMHFENAAWPIIAIAVPASVYLALIDFESYYQWFDWDTTYLFSSQVLIYKLVIVAGLFLSLIRIPIVDLEMKLRQRNDNERLGGK